MFEELGWNVGVLQRRAELRIRNQWIATFFEAQAPGQSEALRLEEGYSAIWVRPDALPRTHLSHWHRTVLEAHLRDGPGVLQVAVET